MKPLKTIRAAMCTAMAFAGAAAQADGVTTTISGFGTVGGTFTSNSSYEYRHDPTEFQGAGNQFDVGLESRLGVQATFDFGSGFSVTAQEVARQRGDKSFDPGTEWLYAQYSPISDVKLRLGRVALATFLISDSREVGYAAPWLRAPNEVYGSEPFNYLDGGQALWHVQLGQFRLGLEAAYGTSQIDFQILGLSITTRAKNIFNGALSLEYGNFLLRIARTTLDSPATLPVTPSFSLTFYDHDKFTSVGLQYDDGKAIVLTEWSKRQEPDVPTLTLSLAESTQWYVAAGWRFGKFTPLVMYGRYDQALTLLQQPGNFGTASASLRYDVAHGVALKAQISRPQAGNSEYWVTANPNSNERVNIYSIGADFVF